MSIVQRLLPLRVGRDLSQQTAQIEQMRKRHLREVLLIENQVYPKPWTPGTFQSELDEMRDGFRHYVVARAGSRVVGYAGLLFSGEDAHVTNIAVDPSVQRRRIGQHLLVHQTRHAIAAGFRNMTLEVRVSNLPAQALYRRFGYAPAGVRKNYYEGVEDAMVMWCHDIDSPEYAERLDRMEAAHAQ